MKTGTKLDSEKARWDLLPLGPMRAVIDVLGFGIRKYAVDNWQHVKDAERRYYAATMRHVTDWRRGERLDPESGKHHLAHAVCCLLFLLWFDEQPQKKRRGPRDSDPTADQVRRGVASRDIARRVRSTR